MVRSQSIDYTIGAIGVSLPAWVTLMTEYMEVIAVVGAVLLVFIRIALAIREWKEKD